MRREDEPRNDFVIAYHFKFHTSLDSFLTEKLSPTHLVSEMSSIQSIISFITLNLLLQTSTLPQLTMMKINFPTSQEINGEEELDVNQIKSDQARRVKMFKVTSVNFSGNGDQLNILEKLYFFRKCPTDFLLNGKCCNIFKHKFIC